MAAVAVLDPDQAEAGGQLDLAVADLHNLVVLGRDAEDMALAANQLIASGGGMALAQQGGRGGA
jgi:adenine deaminase